jgi:cell division transport system permease protein
MIGWGRAHVRAFGEAMRHIARAKGSFVLNVTVIAIALALPFAGLTLLDNIRPLSSQLAVEPEISIFMAMDAPRERTRSLGPQIARLVQEANATGKLEFVPREQALSVLKDRSGLSEAIVALGENPLPDGFVLRLGNLDSAGARRVEALAAQLKGLPGVEYVQIDSAWVQRLAALMDIMRLVLILLAGTLAVVVGAVVFNTIRLQIMTQREEIIVSRMFGATDAYICRPFYYTGALLGAAAGTMALAAVALALVPLNASVSEFARLYGSQFRLVALDWQWAFLLLGASATLGLMGALFSVRRHLARLS